MGTMLSAKLRDLAGPDADPEDHMIAHQCPACNSRHYFPIGTPGADPDDPRWTFDGNVEQPTFNPSMNINKGECHYYLHAGKIIYTSDCRHALAGHTVDLPDLKGY